MSWTFKQLNWALRGSVRTVQEKLGARVQSRKLDIVRVSINKVKRA